MIGAGAVIHYLGGGSEHAPEEFYGRTIISAKIDDEQKRLRIAFSDNSAIVIRDNGQSCCESRYMTTDDDLGSLVGCVLRRIEAKEGPTQQDEYGNEHEIIFVEIGTDAGFITITNHNEHNGYYGGFGLTIELEKA